MISTTSLERSLNVPQGVTIADPLPSSSADEPTTLFIINVERSPKSEISTSLTSPVETPVQRRKAYGKVELRQSAHPPVTRDPEAMVQAGDILYVHLSQILPSQAPHSIQRDNESKALAYPIALLKDGTISLPLLAPIHVEGLTIGEIERKVADAYVAAKIVKEHEIEVVFAKKPNLQK